MTPVKLTNDLAIDTAEMTLRLRISPRRLDAEIVGNAPDGTRLCHSEELADPSVKAVENAIYDNPLLLNDFGKVDIIFACHDLFTAPDGLDDGCHDAMAAVMLPDVSADSVLLRDSARGITLCFAIDANLYNFLRRTYPYASFLHSLSALLRNADAGVTAVCLDDDSTDLLRNDADGNPTYLNCPQTCSPADRAYYIMACLRPGDDIRLAVGERERDALYDLIHKVAPEANILPLPLPFNLQNR